MKTTSHLPGQRAFTLAELLIAIVILAFLASLCLVVSKQAIIKADLGKCAASLRGLHAIVSLYASDHGGTLPPAVASGNAQTYWRKSLLPYWNLPPDVPSMSLTPLHCPAVSRVLKREQGDALFIPYGLNFYLDKIRLANITNPSRKFLATDAAVKEGSLPNEAVSLTLLSKYGRDFHGGGQNILYVDGHIEYFQTITRLTEEPYAPGGNQDIWSP